MIKGLLDVLPFRGALYGGLRLLRPPERIYRHLHFTGPIRIVGGADGSSFRMWHWGNQVENDLFWAGYGRGWEAQSLRIWQALAAEARFVADVGGNTGVYALSAASVSPGARILAIEPVQRIFEKLERNVALNAYPIIADNRAASDRAGVAVLHDPHGPHSYSASLDPTMLAAADTSAVEVATATLDGMLEEHGFPRLDLIKIDVERHEPQVLDGMTTALRRDRPSILIEILDADLGGQVESRIAGLGYCLYRIDEQATGFLVLGLTHGSNNRNYLLCQPDIARRLVDKGLVDRI